MTTLTHIQATAGDAFTGIPVQAPELIGVPNEVLSVTSEEIDALIRTSLTGSQNRSIIRFDVDEYGPDGGSARSC